MTDPFWQIPVPQLLAGLQTTGDGLTTPQVAVLRQKFGTNEAAAPKRTPAWLRIGSASPIRW